MAMKAMPASTSFPPLISQTTKATIAAGKRKRRIFAMTTIIMTPNTRNTNSISKLTRPNEPRQKDTGNMNVSSRQMLSALKSFN